MVTFIVGLVAFVVGVVFSDNIQKAVGAKEAEIKADIESKLK